MFGLLDSWIVQGLRKKFLDSWIVRGLKKIMSIFQCRIVGQFQVLNFFSNQTIWILSGYYLDSSRTWTGSNSIRTQQACTQPKTRLRLRPEPLNNSPLSYMMLVSPYLQICFVCINSLTMLTLLFQQTQSKKNFQRKFFWLK